MAHHPCLKAPDIIAGDTASKKRASVFAAKGQREVWRLRGAVILICVCIYYSAAVELRLAARSVIMGAAAGTAHDFVFRQIQGSAHTMAMGSYVTGSERLSAKGCAGDTVIRQADDITSGGARLQGPASGTRGRHKKGRDTRGNGVLTGWSRGLHAGIVLNIG